jgi:hypothetical protein
LGVGKSGFAGYVVKLPRSSNQHEQQAGEQSVEVESEPVAERTGVARLPLE